MLALACSAQAQAPHHDRAKYGLNVARSPTPTCITTSRDEGGGRARRSRSAPALGAASSATAADSTAASGQSKLSSVGNAAGEVRRGSVCTGDPCATPVARLSIEDPSATPLFARANAPASDNPPEEQWLVDVVINDQSVPGTWLLQRVAGQWEIDAGVLAAAGLRALASPHNESILLSNFADDEFFLDRQRLRLELTVPSDRFQGADLSLANTDVPTVNRQLSGTLGYDVAAGSGDGERWSSGRLDLAIARGDFSCDTAFTWRSQQSNASRGESGCFFDWPDRLVSLRVGDAITSTGAFAQSVRYTGVRVGTDYQLAPYLLTMPALSVEGSARLPSLLEVFIDQRLALRTDLPAGPFAVHDIPATVGSGELRAIVTDALGRDTVFVAPFYSDPTLLRAGFLDWSAEAGRERRGYLTDHDSHGDRFAAVSARRGITDALTLEVHGQAREQATLLGFSATARLGLLGVLEAGAAVSQYEGFAGQASLLGYSFRGRDWSMGLRRWRSDAAYTTLGYALPGLTPARFSQAHLGRRIGRASANVGMILREYHSDRRDQFATASLSVPVRQGGLLHFSVMHPLDNQGRTSLSLNLSLPLGPSTSGYVAASEHAEDGISQQAGIQRSLPPGSGFGYRVQSTHGGDRGAWLAQGAYRGEHGTVEFGASQSERVQSARAQLSGRLVVTTHGAFLTRQDSGGYASVLVGAPGVRVFRDNQPVAVSRDDGIALVSGLRAFQRNPLLISLQDLPMDRRIASEEIVLIPGRNQALATAFDVETTYSVAGTLQRADGAAVPAGATIRSSTQSSLGTVGYDGAFFLALPSREGYALQAEWPSGKCAFSVIESDFDLVYPHVRTFSCHTSMAP